MDLGLDQRELDSCVACGLCLPHCPTYRVTGADTDSPRGRIALMRAVQYGGAPLTPEVVASFDGCVQCRGCEPACPSGVPFGHLIESTREVVQAERRPTPWWMRLGLRVLRHPRLLRAGSLAVAVLQRLRLVPSDRLGLPARLPLRRPRLATTGDDVVLFTGCVMDAWQRDVHAAAHEVLTAVGVGIRPSGRAAPCCGALHAHAGLGGDARAMAARVVDALAGDEPILVDSAGCGAALKDYGRILGTPEAAAFSARVHDVHEWLAARIDDLPTVRPLDLRVAVQDPCHLRHVQGAHLPVRTVLRPFVTELVELDDDGLCCGAGGAYSLAHRDTAVAIRERKTAVIARAAPEVVASANPGCSIHLAATGLDVRHPMELVAAALRSGGN